jgi:iron complex transport system substrate-binding protein
MPDRLAARGRSSLAAAVLLGLAWTACAAAEVPRRVVAVGGAVTEIVYALGAGERLVAADSTSTFPPEARKLPRVGYMRSLSAEGVLSMAPQLVVATSDAGPPTVLRQIRDAGVRLEVLANGHSMESLRTNVRAVAAVLGTPQRGADLDARIAAEWRAVEQQVARYPTRPRVLFLLAHSTNNAMISGEGTAADAMIRLAGGVNAFASVNGYKPLTAEAVVAAAPEVILITKEGMTTIGGPAELFARPGLALTPAGTARRVVALDALYLIGFGPRLPQAVRELAARLHGG